MVFDAGKNTVRTYIKTTQTQYELPISGAPYPAAFDSPESNSDGSAYQLTWRVNCSTPIISYQLEFRELPHGDWVALNVPGDVVGGGHYQAENPNGTGSGRKRHGGVVEHRQTYRLSGLEDGVSYEVRERARERTDELSRIKIRLEAKKLGEALRVCKSRQKLAALLISGGHSYTFSLQPSCSVCRPFLRVPVCALVVAL